MAISDRHPRLPLSSRLSSRQGSPARAAGTLGTDVLHPTDAGQHPALHAGNVAVVTGGASGIGKAAAHMFAELGMRVAIADRDADALAATAEELRVAHGGANVLAVALDVAKFDEVKAFADRVFEWEGEVALVLNNAGIAPKGTSWSGLDAWRAIVDVNLLGVVNVQQAFVPHMMPNENPGLFINTGSKQGITNPPGNAAYNASKAAVKSLTESLAHELRAAQSKLTAHLFVPGWTFTGLGGATKARASKPPGAWTPAQTVKYMLERVRLGEFYIICPDDETSSTLDRLRIRWAAEDVIDGRPALSRWDPEYAPLFEEYVRAGLVSEAQLSPGNGYGANAL